MLSGAFLFLGVKVFTAATQRKRDPSAGLRQRRRPQHDDACRIVRKAENTEKEEGRGVVESWCYDEDCKTQGDADCFFGA